MSRADYAQVEAAAQTVGLQVMGGLHEGSDTILLLGPDEPEFWSVFQASSELKDNAPDPLDRWSKRVIGQLATTFGGTGIYPSDGPPYPPFLQWASDSGRCWSSPVGLLVHDKAGLFASFRGALCLPEQIELPSPPKQSPCSYCMGPCITACPVMAFASGSYDVAACKAHIETDAGADCYQGCKVRRACPVSQRYGRLDAQSEFHMRAFHPK